jgi:hypothetical protein
MKHDQEYQPEHDREPGEAQAVMQPDSAIIVQLTPAYGDALMRHVGPADVPADGAGQDPRDYHYFHGAPTSVMAEMVSRRGHIYHATPHQSRRALASAQRA